MTLVAYRREFEASANRSVSMPIAGACVWFVVALLSTRFDERTGVLVLLFGTGAIFPLALLIAKFRRENLLKSDNPLAKLMGLCVLMVNLLWAVHIPLFLYAPAFVPLSLGHYTCYWTYGIGHSCLVHVSRATLTSDRFSHHFCLLHQYMANVSKANSHPNSQSLNSSPTTINVEDIPKILRSAQL